MNDPIESLGTVVAMFQELENELITTLSLLLRPLNRTTAEVIAAKLSFKNLCSTIDGVLATRFPASALQERFEDVRKRASKVEELRNRLVHSHYDLRELTPSRITYERIKRVLRGGQGLKVESEMIEDATVFTSVTEQICQILTDLRLLNEDLFFEVATKEEIENYCGE